jgi:hypothetical protein
MRWIDAVWIVAGVARIAAGWKFSSIFKLPRDVIGFRCASIFLNLSSAALFVDRPFPWPAFIRSTFVYIFPETVCNRDWFSSDGLASLKFLKTDL